MVPHEAAPKLEIAEAHTRRLGQVLIEAGLISQQELTEALAEQAEIGRLLGEILIARRLVSSPILAQALAVQAGTELVVEQGFGAGLWARIEQRHPSRRITVLPPPGPEDLEHDPESAGVSEPEALPRSARDDYAFTDALIDRIAQQELDVNELRLRLEELTARVTALEAPPKRTRTRTRATAKGTKKAPAPAPKKPATRRRGPPASG